LVQNGRPILLTAAREGEQVTLGGDDDGTGTVNVGQALAREIVQTPEDYHAVVHKAEFSGGAVRGQPGR
jgi:hypothetical protein